MPNKLGKKKEMEKNTKTSQQVSHDICKLLHKKTITRTTKKFFQIKQIVSSFNK